MAEDVSAQMQVAIVVALTGALCAILVGLLALQLRYAEGVANKYIEAVGETSQKDFENLVFTSRTLPANGAEVYRVCMNNGLIFESITTTYLDGTTRSITAFKDGYVEDAVAAYVEYFMTDDTTRLFVLDADRTVGGLWTLSCTEVERGE